jgi:hypothetical protein
MKRMNLFILWNMCIFCAIICVCGFFLSPVWSIEVAPKVAGPTSSDTAYVTFTVMDTTYYPLVCNADSMVLLRYNPNGTLLDSLGENAATVKNLTTGYYRVAYRASNGSGTQGIYTGVVKAWRGGALRGSASYAYEVIGDNINSYLSHLDMDVSSVGVIASAINSEVTNINAWNPSTTGILIASGGIPVGAFANGSITNAAFAGSAIDSTKIAPDAIGATEIANNAIRDGYELDINVPDSMLISNIVWRIMWGIAKGIGNDSSTTAQRVINDMDSVMSRLEELVWRALYWCSCDECQQRIWLDSLRCVKVSDGSDSLKSTIYFYYDTDTNLVRVYNQQWR